MSLLKRLFNRKRNDDIRLIYEDDVDRVSSDPGNEDTEYNEEQGTNKKKKERPEGRTDFLNQLFF